MPPKFISDEEMAAIEAPKKKKFISDEEMAALEPPAITPQPNPTPIDAPPFETAKGAGAVPLFLDSLRIGTDALASPQSVSDLVTQHQTDPSYKAGELATDRITPEAYDPKTGEISIPALLAKTGVQTAQEVVLDPINLATLGGGYLLEKGAPTALKAARALTGGLEDGAMWGAGKLGRLFTNDLINEESMKAARKFTPKQQWNALDTYKDASRTFGDMKQGAVDTYQGTYKNILNDPNAVPSLQGPDVVDRMARRASLAGGTPVDATDVNWQNSIDQLRYQIENLKDGGVATSQADLLLKRVNDIEARGATAAPELDSLLDHIRTMKVTPLDNERAVYPGLRRQLEGPDNIADDIWGAYDQSAPEMAQARRRTADAATMLAGERGGKLTAMYRTGQELSDLRSVAAAVEKGDAGGMFSGFMRMAAHHPQAWNKVVAGLRMPAAGVETIAEFAAKNPTTAHRLLGAFQAAIIGGNEANNALDAITSMPPEPAQTPEAMPQPTSQAQPIFLKAASVEPRMFLQLSDYAMKSGNQDLVPFFQMAAQGGMEQAMQMYATMDPAGWAVMAPRLQEVALAGAKSSPGIKASMRRTVTNDPTLTMAEKAAKLQAINDNTIFNSTPPSGP